MERNWKEKGRDTWKSRKIWMTRGIEEEEKRSPNGGEKRREEE